MYLKLALQNIFRNRARTAITLAAIAFGCVTVIVTGGLMADALSQLRESIIQSSLGHLQVYKRGYIDKGLVRPFEFMIADPDAAAAVISEVPQVRRVSPRLNFFGLLSTGETTISFMGEGVVPEAEKDLSAGVRLLSGEDLSSGDLFKVLLATGLARALLASPGDPLVVVANTKVGAINALDVVAQGVFATGSQEVDNRALRVPLKTAQRLLQTGAVHSLVVRLERSEDTDLVKARLEELFRQRGLDLEVRPWYAMADFYVKAETFLKRQFLILKVIIGIVVVLSVFNTMNMSVLERIGEIGTIMALGYKKRGVARLFLLEGVVLGLLGVGVGLVSGWAVAELVSWVGIPVPPPPGRSLPMTARVMIVPEVFSQAFWISLAATLVSSVYPAAKASRLEIAEALRQNI